MITSPVVLQPSTEYTLENWMQNPPDKQEWVDGKLLEKNGMTLKHSRIQGNLYPDVAYLTPELETEFGNEKVFL